MVRIIQGDVREVLQACPTGHVHCVVTSPPYWGLRDYGVPGMIGLEDTFDEHLAVLVDVFREVWRVLRDDGTLWLNYGDFYYGSWGNYAPTGEGGQRAKHTERLPRPAYEDTTRRPPQTRPSSIFKKKDLMLMPARVAMALQADGWFLRSEIVWVKKSAMPESVKDRPANAHEKVFLLTKHPKYFYDSVAVLRDRTHPDNPTFRPGAYVNQRGVQTNAERTEGQTYEGHKRDTDKGANLRNVWTLSHEPFIEAHFATFPTKLVEPCIKAGTSEKGACVTCGAPWTRDATDTPGYKEQKQHRKNVVDPEKGGELVNTAFSKTPQIVREIVTRGWKPSCTCQGADVQPCVVLDPFGGSGTTALVADRLGRDALIIEINKEYAEMARTRIDNDNPLFAGTSTPEAPEGMFEPESLPLFGDLEPEDDQKGPATDGNG